MEGYLRKDVAAITGVKFATVQQYTERGLITASINNPSGRGTNRLYNVSDMFDLMVCREFVRIGVSHADIKMIMPEVQTQKIINVVMSASDGKVYYLIVYNLDDGYAVDIVGVATPDDQIQICNRGAKSIIVIDLSDIKKGLLISFNRGSL